MRHGENCLVKKTTKTPKDIMKNGHGLIVSREIGHPGYSFDHLLITNAQPHFLAYRKYTINVCICK